MDWDGRAHLQHRACKYALRWGKTRKRSQNNTSDCCLLGCKWVIYHEYPSQSLYGCISKPPCSSTEGSVTEIWNRGQRATQQIGFFFFFNTILWVLCQCKSEVKYSRALRQHSRGESETFCYLLRLALCIYCVLKEFYWSRKPAGTDKRESLRPCGKQLQRRISGKWKVAAPLRRKSARILHARW